jgi:hypothetical protein
MSQHLPGRTGKNHENLSHDNQSLRWDLNTEQERWPL